MDGVAPLRNMPAVIRRIRGVLWRTLRMFFIASICMVLIGGAMNFFVTIANGGRMPVAEKPEHVLFVIGDPSYGVKYFRFSHEHDPIRQSLTDDMWFTIFADRIPSSFKWIDPNSLPQVVVTGMHFVNFPVGGESIASIGDLLMWGGLALFFPLFVIFLPRLIQISALFFLWYRRHRRRKRR